MHRLFLLLFSLLLSATTSPELATASPDPATVCAAQPSPHTLIPNKLTVLISGHSPRRLPLLRRIILSLSSHPLILSINILWSNASTPSSLLSLHLPLSPPRISLIRHVSPSLNLRFLPLPSIRTLAVAVCDDDVVVPHPSLSLAFSLWQAGPTSLVGFFPRSHDLDLGKREWVYSVHPERYSILLTKFVLLHRDLLWRYSCSPAYASARSVVDRERNCEDILMNFVAAMEGRARPVLVDSGGVRDWGDPRNRRDNASDTEGTGDAAEAGELEMKKVGLSSRGEMHWRKRGECIREFHKLLGRMPLKYSYGKVVAGITEQAICRKRGKLVPCNRDD